MHVTLKKRSWMTHFLTLRVVANCNTKQSLHNFSLFYHVLKFGVEYVMVYEATQV